MNLQANLTQMSTDAKAIKASVIPNTMECSDSGSITFQMICTGLAPMDWAASITPRSTSNSEDSMTRAINGAAVIVSGTIAAVVPIEEPTIMRVKGIMATIRMINGVERVAFTIAPNTLCTNAFGIMWSFLVTVRITPKGRPISVASTMATNTI